MAFVVCVFEPDKGGEGLAAHEQLNEVFGPFTEEEADDFATEWQEMAGDKVSQFQLVIQPIRRDIVYGG